MPGLKTPYQNLIGNIRAFCGEMLWQRGSFNEGLCFGLTHMWIQAVLCGENEEQRFLNRLAFLCEPSCTFQFYNSPIMGLLDAVEYARSYVRTKCKQDGFNWCFLPPTIRMLLEIPAFIEGVLLYQDQDSGILSSIRLKHNVPLISRLMMPQQLEMACRDRYPVKAEKPSLAPIYSTVIGPEREGEPINGALVRILNELRISERFAILLASKEHVIGLTYSPGIGYRLFDQNNLSLTSDPIQVRDSPEISSYDIYHALRTISANASRSCYFSLILYMPPQATHNNIHSIINQLPQSSTILEMLQQNPHLNLPTLLYFACRNNQPDMIRALLNCSAINVDAGEGDDRPPLCVACMNLDDAVGLSIYL